MLTFLEDLFRFSQIRYNIFNGFEIGEAEAEAEASQGRGGYK